MTSSLPVSTERSAGRPLDVKVALHVMKWTVSGRAFIDERGDLRTFDPTSFGSFEPSRDIAAAYEMEAKLVADGHGNAYAGFLCAIVNGYVVPQDVPQTLALIRATPLDRCLAALKALGVE